MVQDALQRINANSRAGVLVRNLTESQREKGVGKAMISMRKRKGIQVTTTEHMSDFPEASLSRKLRQGGRTLTKEGTMIAKNTALKSAQ